MSYDVNGKYAIVTGAGSGNTNNTSSLGHLTTY